MNNDDARLDARVVEFHLRRGTLSHEDYDKYLKSLPDEAEEAVETETRFSNHFELRNYGTPADE